MITSTSNPTIKWVRSLQAQRRAREAEGLFVVEGVRLAEEAARAGTRARLVLHTPELDARSQAAAQALAALGAQLLAVAPHVLEAASDTRTPAGLLAVTPCPAWPAPDLRPEARPLAVVLDRLSDPGNLGTILRAADAAGASLAWLTPGTVDPYNPKVVRAAMGAHFRLPLFQGEWELAAARLAGLPLWLAEAGAGQPYDAVDWRGPAGLIIGSEAEGPGPEARAATALRVHIPMPGAAESLNAAVAAGVLLFEAARQRRNAEMQTRVDSARRTG